MRLEAPPSVVYVSTGGFQGRPAEVAVTELVHHGIEAIELSGGVYSETLQAKLEAHLPAVRFQIHNYFPPAPTPFVLNLASADAAIGDRSVAHVKDALRWCLALGADRYSFHAGFLVDPQAAELGKPFVNRCLSDREAGIELFVERVSSLAEIARKADIMLMVENNVLSATNALTFGANPFLMCAPLECRGIMQRLPDNVRMVIDVAHLKVSAKSLSFDPADMFDQCQDWIGAYHLSDNDGTHDTNQAFTQDAWFWRYLRPDVGYYSVEVYGCAPSQLLEQVALVQSAVAMGGT